MKIILVTLTALAALTVAPIASQAKDKEVQNAHYTKGCCQRNRQVALLVSGNGVASQPAPAMQSVSKAQVGQGVGITFFTGYR